MLEAALNTVSIGYEGANKYKVRVAHKSIVAARHCWVSPTLSRTRLTQVRDPAGRPMYFVVEDSGCCSRQCCNPNHSMTLQVTDMTGERVMTMKRPWTWNCCCLCGNQPVCRVLGDDAAALAAARPRLAESREAPDLPPIGRGQPPGEDI